ncbi:hypothetical protein OIE13_22190 [Streptosporangium sp. NBC_01810]|uniref:hypothetical protein n=1 Tax=Streptosporangium sp. NBC_01810 TaxID=2975951 RepID=UPI002DD942F0|nr:hypothetical protein [Streptosporangium sp. NBC_01810]WSA23653.1 hypothetical protein OIE13_22190 [Streptosporangium sp. NBC_01810]
MNDDWTRPLLMAGALYALAGIVSITGAALMQLAWVTVAAAAGVVVALAVREASVAAMAYAVAVIAAAGAWLAYTVIDSPWTATAMTSWAIATCSLGPIYPAMRVYRARLAARTEAEREEAELRRHSSEWVRLWARAGVKGLAETGRQETRAGLRIYMDLPEDGKVGLAAMDRACGSVEIAHGNLRRGAVSVEEGELAHQVIVHVSAIDILAETIPIPDDVTPRTGDQPFGVGRHEDAEETLLNLDKHLMIVGITDAGKSNLTNVVIKEAGRMVDTLIWVIDPKGGRMASPWLQAWLAGHADRPVIDWVATTPAEWDLMLNAAEAIRAARAEARIGGEKVTASATCPRILIVIDEIADVVASRATLKKIKDLVRKGRSEEIKLAMIGQRGTVTMFGDGDTKSQIGNVIGLGVARVSDGQAVFPDDHTIARSLARMQHPGCMYVKAGLLSRPMPSKGYRIEYNQIPLFAAALADLRPGLDELSAAAAGDAYAQRWEWERCGHLVGARAASAAADVPAPARSGGGGVPDGPVDDAAAFAGLVSRLGPTVPPILSAVEGIFEALGGPARLHTRLILEQLPPGAGAGLTARRLGMLLGALGVSPVDAWEEPDGTRGRGYRREHLAAARTRIETGQAVPAEVYAWPGQADRSPS